MRNRRELATSLYLEQRDSVLIHANQVLGAFFLLRSAYENPSFPPVRPHTHIHIHIHTHTHVYIYIYIYIYMYVCKYHETIWANEH